MNKQKGFSIVELVVVGAFVLCFISVATLVYVCVHFIGKFW